MSKTQALTANTIKSIVYSDFFTDFSRHVNTGQLNKKTNEDAVKQSVRNLLLTDHYERPFQPKIGSNLRALLFENWTPALQLQCEKYIEEVFDLYEPRADLLNIQVVPNIDGHAISVTISFRIINSTEPTTLELLVERTR